ncbi:MAG: hypothetical protein WD969_12900 [Paracoccaceae bacterium]
MPEHSSAAPLTPTADRYERSEFFLLATADLTQDFGLERLMDLLQTTNPEPAR